MDPKTPTEHADPAPLALVAAPAADVVPLQTYLASLGSERSRQTVADALRRVLRVLGRGDVDPLTVTWHELDYEHLQLVRARLQEAYAPKTVNMTVSVLRQILKQAYLLGRVDRLRVDQAAAIGSVRGSREMVGRHVTVGELRRLFEGCDGSVLGTRDAAMLAFAYGGGLRRAEIAGLQLVNLTEDHRSVRFVGKGNKERTVPLPPGSVEAIEAWLEVRGVMPGPLITPVRRGGHIVMRAMNPRSVRVAMLARAKQAAVSGFTPHDLRRTFIGDLLDGGADVVTVSKLAGHSNVTQTGKYDRRPDATRRKAVELLHVPYQRAPTGQPVKSPPPVASSRASTGETAAGQPLGTAGEIAPPGGGQQGEDT